MALAQALSMSAAASPQPYEETVSEDEMLRTALEESRLEALRQGHSDVGPPVARKIDYTAEEDRKMPIQAFDPY